MIGNKYQYNKTYRPEQVVTVIKSEGNYVLIQFPSGTKICTNEATLYPLKEGVKHEPTEKQLKLF